MVGDRLNTDILFGQQGGLSTLLVLTGKFSFLLYTHTAHTQLHQGITKLAEITEEIEPEYVTESLGDLFPDCRQI